MRSAHALLAFLAFTLVSVVWTWPLAARFSSRIPHDPGDPILNVWILWWNAQRLPLTEAWWNAPVFFPAPGALALSEHLLGLSVFATPLQLAGANPLAAYNATLLLSYVLSALFMYLLAYRLTASRLAAACAAAAFAFAPYRAGHLAHIQVLTSQWMPAMLLGMHGYIESGRRRWLLLFGASWLLQALSNGYYMLFLPALVVPWVLWFTDWRRAPARGLTLVGAWILSSMPLLPVLLKYREVHAAQGLARTLGEIRDFSATLQSFTHPPPLLAFWQTGYAATAEGHLFPGLLAVVLVAGGVLAIGFRRDLRQAVARRSPLLFYAAAAVLMAALALGPGGEREGPASWLHPYTWLMWLPGYSGLRVPARFAMLVQLCLAVAAGLSLAVFVNRGGWRRSALASLAVLVVAGEGLMARVPLVPPPQRIALEGIPPVSVIEIPTDDVRVSVAAMYRAIRHRQPLVSGYSGHTPAHYAILSLALWRGDASVLHYLARDRPLLILVNYEADPGGGFRKMIAEVPGVQFRGISGAGAMFLLPQPPPEPSPVGGNRLPSHVTRGGHRRLITDLGEPRTVTGIEFNLRDRYEDLAERVLIEASEDGLEWRDVWLGWTGEFALDAALRDPLVAPVRLPLPAVRTRYLRIYPAERWLGDELVVRGR